MFSNEERQILGNSPLAEVICQLRFPEILAIGAQPPVEFQERIRDAFPQFGVRKESPAPKITGVPGNLVLENQPPVTNYQFVSEDGVWRVNLTNTFISLCCTRYTCWEDFAKRLDQPLAAFIQVYKPAYFQRVGLRYLNVISRKQLSLEETPWRELMEPEYLGILASEAIDEKQTGRCSMDTEFTIRGGCRAKIHAGPGMVKRGNQPDKEVKFIFDLDLYMPGNVPVNLSAGALQTLHSQAYPIFRGAITDTLFDALDPRPL